MSNQQPNFVPIFCISIVSATAATNLVQDCYNSRKLWEKEKGCLFYWHTVYVNIYILQIEDELFLCLDNVYKERLKVVYSS